MARDDDVRRPVSRGDTEQIELDREQARITLRLGDVRVDAIRVRVDDERAAVVVVVQLLLEVTPELEEARPDVALQLPLPEDLRATVPVA